MRLATAGGVAQNASAVLMVQGRREWPLELLAMLTRAGYLLVWVDDVRLVPFFVLSGGVAAVLVDAHGLELLGVLALRKCREYSPATAIVVMAHDSSAPAVFRALESGATAFLSWPAEPQTVSQVLASGGVR